MNIAVYRFRSRLILATVEASFRGMTLTALGANILIIVADADAFIVVAFDDTGSSS